MQANENQLKCQGRFSAWNSFLWKAEAKQPKLTLNLGGENSTLNYLTTKIVIQRSSRDAKYSVPWWQIMVMLITQ